MHPTLPRFLTFLFVLVLNALAATSLGLLVSAATNSIKAATSLSPVSLLDDVLDAPDLFGCAQVVCGGDRRFQSGDREKWKRGDGGLRRGAGRPGCDGVDAPLRGLLRQCRQHSCCSPVRQLFLFSLSLRRGDRGKGIGDEPPSTSEDSQIQTATLTGEGGRVGAAG
eukprot:3168018-Rhodomonas_salina.2